MKRPASLIGGIVLAVAGIVFTLQGLGVLSGSSMSNTTTWSVLGPIITIVGAALIFRGTRLRDSESADSRR
jgi:drug/metabolite transporter (DMT)-like permease